jgi:hypothetical protein
VGTVFGMTLVMKLHPASIFLAPIYPKYIVVISKQGIPLYTEKLGTVENDDLLSGAIASVNTLINESITIKTDLQIIKLRDTVIYTEFAKTFFVVFIDQFESTILQLSLGQFVKAIETQVSEKLQNWMGDMGQFEFLQPVFHQIFDFLPQFFSEER